MKLGLGTSAGPFPKRGDQWRVLVLRYHVNTDVAQAPMTWINVFLVVLGLISDFSIRSPDDRTTDWAVSLVVLAMIAVMVGISHIITGEQS